MKTIKFVATNAMTTETNQGVVRMEETRHQPLFSVLRGSSDVMRSILHSPIVMCIVGLLAILGIYRTISNTFWSILVTERLMLPPATLSLYQFLRSVCMLLVFFFMMPRLRNADPYRTMLLGFLGLIASQLILIATPPGGYAMLAASTVVEAFSLPLVSTLLRSGRASWGCCSYW
jgi:hypothetical protein